MAGGLTVLGATVLGLVVLGGLVGLVLAVLALQNREGTPAGTAYGALMAAAGIWCLTYAVLLVSPTPEVARTIDPLVVITAMLTPYFWFAFAVVYTGHGDWLTRPVLVVLFGEPLAYFALHLTNPVHHLVYDQLNAYTWEGLLLLEPSFNAIVWMQIAYMYLISMAGLALLAAFVTRTRNVHRRQAGAILLGAVLTMAGNAIFLSGLSPHGALDVTPVFFVANGIVIFWAFFKYDFLDVAPLAQDVLVEEMNDPIVVLDDDRTVVDYNPAAAARLGLRDESVGKPVAVTIPGLPDALSSGEPLTITDPDGSPAVYDPRPSSLTDQYGIERGELVVLREVTLLTRREETLAALQSATRDLMQATAVEEVADAAIETASDVLDHRFAGFLLYDDERGVLRSVSLTDPVRERLNGEEMVYDDRGGIVWEAFEEGELLIEESYDMGAPARMDELPLASTILLPLGDHGLLGVGSIEDVEYTDDDIRFIRILASAIESALDRLAREQEVREGRDALAERNERLEEFASIVSHDLRTPLTTAKGYLSLADKHVETDEAARYLEKVDDSHDRMAALIEDLLALARHGAVVDDLEPVAIDEVAIDAWQTAGDLDASLAVEDPPSPVLADRERVRTLFENLFGNCIEHAGADVSVVVGALDGEPAADGGATTDGAAIIESDRSADDRLSAGGAPETAGFYVEDDGPGIPEDEREHVFEQGFSKSADDGTGLGLAIVDRIVDAHGWDVRITDGATGGARFEFSGIELAPGR